MPANTTSTPYTPTVGFLCGSLRDGSINRQLELALMHQAKTVGLAPEAIDLGDYDMPLFHGDLLPPKTAAALVKRIRGYDGIVVVSPEYNGSLPPLLKNMIDWTSTVTTNHFREPVYGIASCTPGPMSGIMCMRQIQYILTRLGADVVPTQVGVGLAAQAFDADGRLVAGRSAEFADMMLGAIRQRVLEKRALAAAG